MGVRPGRPQRRIQRGSINPWAGLLLALLVWCGGPVLAQDSAGQYRLAAGDVVSVSVFGEADLSFGQLRLNEAGSISYPFLGDVPAAGLTARELEQRIHDGLLGDYLVNPRVRVSVLEYRQYFINGEVGSPGAYSWVPGLNLRRAVTFAGGFTDRASRRRIDLVPEGADDDDAIRIDLDHPIQPGDTITIRTGLF